MDKGVHACTQVCLLKVEVPKLDLLENNMEGVRQQLEAQSPLDI
jgi:tRNA U38,U39,U40 pseudouridine synthase TruA